MTDEISIVRGMLHRASRGLLASHPIAKELLGFGQRHGPWLFGLTPGNADKLTWTGFKQALRAAPPRVQGTHPVLVLGQELARLLGLDHSDTAILLAVLVFDRLPRVSELAELVAARGQSLPTVLGETAGLNPGQAERQVRQHILFRLGFVNFKANRQGKVEMSLRWTLERLLDRQPGNAEAILELMVGPRQPAPLPFHAFTHVEEADFLLRLLSGALKEGASGNNILIHGPPGTGNTNAHWL